jgi:DinB superfamily
METKAVICSQYLAALDMLKQTLARCPPDVWDAPADSSKFWHIAYHTVFYTQLYLAPSEQDFVPWAQHRDQSQFLGPLPWPPHAQPQIEGVYSQADLLDYLALCQAQVTEQVAALDLEAPSGFDWLPMGARRLTSIGWPGGPAESPAGVAAIPAAPDLCDNRL